MVVALGLMLVAGTALAGSAAVLAGPRALFQRVDQALQQGDRSLLMQDRARLRTYPLYPYLIYDDLSQRLDQAPAAEVDQFLQRYADLPIAGELRQAWLQQLGKTARWQQFLADYRSSGDRTLACYYRQALLATGQRKQALSGVETLWLSGYSQPNACDPVFAAWREQGGLTQALVWQRFQLAMQADQSRLGAYLQGLLSGGPHAVVAKIWLAVTDDPAQVLNHALIAQAGNDAPAILLAGLRHWSNQDSVAAAVAFDQLRSRYTLPQTPAWGALQRRLALFVASRGDASAMHRLNALPKSLVNNAVAAWRVRVELQRQNWSGVLQQLGRMSQSQAAGAQWRYWRARALAKTGRAADARKLYQALAGERDYYGFLAADRLQRPYSLDNAALPRAAARLAALQQQPGMVRARELFLVDRPADARAEWDAVLSGADPIDPGGGGLAGSAMGLAQPCHRCSGPGRRTE